MTKTKTKAITLMGATASAFLLAMASPTAAHPVSDSINGGHGGVHTGHTYVYACDDRADGDGVRVEFMLQSGGRGAVGDTNGSEPGCGGRTVTTHGNPVVYFRVCRGDSCPTPWLNA